MSECEISAGGFRFLNPIQLCIRKYETRLVQSVIDSVITIKFYSHRGLDSSQYCQSYNKLINDVQVDFICIFQLCIFAGLVLTREAGGIIAFKLNMAFKTIARMIFFWKTMYLTILRQLMSRIMSPMNWSPRLQIAICFIWTVVVQIWNNSVLHYIWIKEGFDYQSP